MSYTRPYYRLDLTLLQETLTAAQSAASQHTFVLKYAMKANHESKVLQR
ncbi:MAG: hypothetical protein P8O07_06365 [Crocinitomicaceae bacterium]|nr:hypothetical protein [Crocinitomicaceae bacterium]